MVGGMDGEGVCLWVCVMVSALSHRFCLETALCKKKKSERSLRFMAPLMELTQQVPGAAGGVTAAIRIKDKIALLSG